MKITFYRFQESLIILISSKCFFEVVDVPRRIDIFVNCEELGNSG